MALRRHTGFYCFLFFLLVQWQSTSFAQTASYSKAQEKAGKKEYAKYCASCHGSKLKGIHLAPSLVGERFDQSWRGKPLEFLSFHVRRMSKMPVANQDSLSDETHTNILAYILKSNGLKRGDALPINTTALDSLVVPRLEGATYDPDAPVEASAEQVALLKNLPNVTDEMLNNPSPDDWLRWGRGSDGLSFSPLKQINRENVTGLKPAWRRPLRPGSSMSAPLVHQGVMFLHTFPDTVLAIDATNGNVLWRYQYSQADRSSSKMGIGLHDDKIYVPTSDNHVLALNAKTGKLIWNHEIDMKSSGAGRGRYQLRTAPLTIGNKVIQGVTASFMPKGGFIVAIDGDSGDELWRFNTIARPGEPWGNTWNGLPLEKRSGGSVWHQGTYDAELNLIYFGVAPTYDTGPLLHEVDKAGISNSALYTNSTVALDADTGKLIWHYQHLANGQWDLDWAFERQIVTVAINGKDRKVVMNVGKMAILDALDAATGEYLFSVDTGVQNVITAIDPETGAKTIDPAKLPDPDRPTVVCPSALGARNWPPTSYSPQTKLAYIPLTEICMLLGPDGAQILTSGVRISPAKHPDSSDGMLGRLQAVDIANQKLAWTHDQPSPFSTGILTTGGGLLFSGDIDPSLKAFDDSNGKLLWETRLSAEPTSSLITYSVNGRQYVAVVVGVDNIHVGALSGIYESFSASLGKPHKAPSKGGAGIWAFTLDEPES
tara:strand:- start:189 stop:2330 length:2142 start_codon:yes stop_codon:yes gene_type:complete